MSDKSKERIINEICEEVLRKVKASAGEKRDILLFSRSLSQKLTEKLRSSGIDAQAQIQGSVAKDTWLAEERDVDIFILIPKKYTKEVFPRVLDVVKTFVGEKWLEAYAEHPYVKAEVEGYEVDFVPCFQIERGEKAISSADRTPLHTSYVNRRLDEETKNEVRLLKRFMKGLGVYGSEIKIGGFSGYLCELLTLHCGSFARVLNFFTDWDGKRIIDPEGYYKGRRKEAKRIFEEPLVVVDPVDKRRNVASALRKDRLDEFIAAAGMFLKSPNSLFFYPRETEALSTEKLIQKITSRGSAVIFLRFGQVNAVPDVLWGQLYRSQRALGRILHQNDFRVIRDCVWSDEKDVNFLIFELKHRFLPSVVKHFGPPIHKRVDCETFVRKHLSSPTTISGPRIEEGRWMVESKRSCTDVVNLLCEKLKDGGRSHGIAKLISQAISKKLEIFVNTEISNLYSRDTEFAKFLTEYLDGRPKWLRGTCLF